MLVLFQHLGLQYTKKQWMAFNARRMRGDKNLIRKDLKAVAAIRKAAKTTGGGPPGEQPPALDPDLLQERLSRYTAVVPIRDGNSTFTTARGETVRAENMLQASQEEEEEDEEDESQNYSQSLVIGNHWNGNHLRVRTIDSMREPAAVRMNPLVFPVLGGPPVHTQTSGQWRIQDVRGGGWRLKIVVIVTKN